MNESQSQKKRPDNAAPRAKVDPSRQPRQPRATVSLGSGRPASLTPQSVQRQEGRAPASPPRREAAPSGSTPRSGAPVRPKTSRENEASGPRPQSASRRPVPRKKKKKPATPADKPKKKIRLVRRDENEDMGGSTLIPSLIKAVVYIMSLLVISGIISYFAISVGNDVFAFVKSGDPVQITVAPGTDTATLGEILHDYGVIKYPQIFDFYIKLRYGDKLEYEPGDYTVDPSQGYDSLVYTFVKSNKTELVTVVVSIPEGYTVKQIISTLVNKYGLSSEEELTDVIQNEDFDYWFIDELEKSGIGTDRKYRLEGYLYPDTYYYYSNASAKTIINKMLKNFDTKLKNTFKNSTAPGDTYQEKILNLCKEREMSFDEIVTLASMIQMEAKYDYEYPKVSAVFNNRLRNPSATNGMLESCATVLYVLGIRVPILSDEQTQTDDPYNTYINKGLPPGAISNPTYLAINYALYPDMECGWERIYRRLEKLNRLDAMKCPIQVRSYNTDDEVNQF